MQNDVAPRKLGAKTTLSKNKSQTVHKPNEAILSKWKAKKNRNKFHRLIIKFYQQTLFRFAIRVRKRLWTIHHWMLPFFRKYLFHEEYKRKKHMCTMSKFFILSIFVFFSSHSSPNIFFSFRSRAFRAHFVPSTFFAFMCDDDMRSYLYLSCVCMFLFYMYIWFILHISVYFSRSLTIWLT